jgi:hypothetical protein
VADEHLATEITLAQMERLRGHLVPPLTPAGRALVACVEGEGHGIAARMLADFLLIDGWSVDYVGTNTPTADLVDLVRRRRPDLVALSVTQAEHLPALGDAAKGLRRLSRPQGLAGGSRSAAARGRPPVWRWTPWPLTRFRACTRRGGLTGPVPPAPGEDYFARLGGRVQELALGQGLDPATARGECGTRPHLHQPNRARQAEPDARRALAPGARASRCRWTAW